MFISLLDIQRFQGIMIAESTLFVCLYRFWITVFVSFSLGFNCPVCVFISQHDSCSAYFLDDGCCLLDVSHGFQQTTNGARILKMKHGSCMNCLCLGGWDDIR